MKKILKSRIFLVIITMVVSIGTTVCGAILYNANQVAYTPSDTNWNVSSVDEALNDLYNTANTKFTNFKSTIAQAITDKGVATSATDSTETMASNIRSLISLDDGLTLNLLWTNNSSTTNEGSVSLNMSNYDGIVVVTRTLDMGYTSDNKPRGFYFIPKNSSLTIGVSGTGGISADSYNVSRRCVSCTNNQVSWSNAHADLGSSRNDHHCHIMYILGYKGLPKILNDYIY